MRSTVSVVLAVWLLKVAAAVEYAVTQDLVLQLKRDADWTVLDYELNPFKGWTKEEVQSLLGVVPESQAPLYPEVEPTDPAMLPRSLNWQTIQADCVHGARNQGNCGSCWAFAAVGMVSDRCCLKGQDKGWLAPQEILSCAGQGGCRGGQPITAAEYASARGLVPETCWPYQAKETKCPSQCHDGKDWKASHICKCPNVHQCNGATAVKTCLLTGPIAACMFVYRDFLNYRGGIYRHVSGEYYGFHAVRIFGYGEDYWHCSNSWGTSWGEQGFFKIAFGQCGIETGGGVSGCNVCCDPTP